MAQPQRTREGRVARTAWWTTIATAGLAALLVWRLNADYGVGGRGAAREAEVLAVAGAVGGLAATVLAVIAVVRERGRARVGAWLLLALIAVQPVFGWLGFQFATVSPVREQSMTVVWAIVSGALLYGAGVIVLRHDR